jgi:heme exporter protein A
MPAIEAEGVGFAFGVVRVLQSVSLRVERGSVLTIFGPNGAGKTTFLKILAGLLRPDTGRVLIEGVDVRQDPGAYRRSIGVISHHPYVYPQLSGRENLEFYGRLYGLEHPRNEARRMLDEMGLGPVGEREASSYSRGMLQRLAVGRALLHRPRVLLLDEPFTGLDREAGQKLEAAVDSLRDGERTVVMTTHDLDGGLGLADRVAVLAAGRIALEMPARGLERASLLARYDEAVAAGRASYGGRPAS